MSGTGTEPTGRAGVAGAANRATRVAVVGGGVSGLAAAHRLREVAPGVDVTVFEAGPRPGGVLRTSRRDGFLIEASADSFITTFPWGLDLCRRLGLESELLETDPTHRRAFVVNRGRLLPIPDGLLIMAPSRVWPMVRTPILSPWGKLRMGAEWFVAKGDGRDESLGSFATRRFGREAFERLIQPLVSGMYTGDPWALSVKATLPRFLEMEQNHGSLIRAVRRGGGGPGGNSGSGARYSLFVGLRDGFGRLVETLVGRLPNDSVRCETDVKSIVRTPEGRWRLDLGESPPFEADAVIVATPVSASARLLAPVDAELGSLLGRVRSTGTAVVSLGYRREQVGHALDGFGFVVPLREKRAVLSGSFSSVKFAGRAPEGHVLLRVFLGGASRPDLLEQDDDTLVATAERELAALLGVRGTPVLRQVDRWRGVMPQYEVGHLDLVDRIEGRARALPGLALAGNAFRGVGVPQCIRSGEAAAESVAAFVAKGTV